MIVLDYYVHVLYLDLGLLGLLDLVHDFGHYLGEFVLTFYYAVKNIRASPYEPFFPKAFSKSFIGFAKSEALPGTGLETAAA